MNRSRTAGFTLVLCWMLLASGSTSAPPRHLTSKPVATPLLEVQAVHGAVNQSVLTTGCGRPSLVKLGMSANQTISANPTVSNGSSVRSYIVHVPASYNAATPVPVILSFHGYSGTASGMDHGSGFSPLADTKNFLAVYPQGLLDGDSGKPFWASVGTIDYGIDDVLFVSNVLDDLQKKFCVDTRRIYATGFSNGGGMTGFLACRLAERIAAFAPISGNFYALPGGCEPGRPVPILNFHGTKDGLLPYNGIPVNVNPRWPLPAIPQWLQEWANRDGCVHGPTVFLQDSHVTGEQWTGCQGNATVVHYRIEGGGHSGPPPINGRSPAMVMWLFFQAHLLP